PQNDRLRDGVPMADVLGYARVSTGDQDVAGQARRLEQAGAIRVFTDVRSGKSMDRPGLIELLAYARRGDTLAVVRLDRLGRSLAELISVVEQLKGRGVALLSLEEKLDTSSAAGELIFHVFGAIAQFERRLIAERTKDGIAAARARGKVPGRQPVDADRVQAALKLVQAGLSPTKAASQLGLGRSTVYREVAAAGLARLT
ncbi:recombinase family protein, partial [Methylorubrum zatmanii]